MELPQRKPNRLSEYDYSTNGADFITICTQDRRKILSDIVGDDAHIVPKPYGTIAEKYIRNVPEIEKYVIMPDHIHMIIRLDNGSMWASTPTDANVGAVTGRPQVGKDDIPAAVLRHYPAHKNGNSTSANWQESATSAAPPHTNIKPFWKHKRQGAVLGSLFL